VVGHDTPEEEFLMICKRIRLVQESHKSGASVDI